MSQNTTAMQRGACGETTGATDMTTQQPEALRLTEIARYCFRSEGMSDPPEQFESPTGDMVDYFDHVEIEKALLARITELEAQLSAIGAGGVSPLMAGAERWVSVDERLPEPQKPVLLDIGYKHPIRAQMVPQYTLTVGTDAADDFGEYDEETDEWYCPAGWYEWNQHEEIHWAVNEKPIAWSELPAAPSISGETK